jgi:glycerol-3-phosphate dehydrogenase
VITEPGPGYLVVAGGKLTTYRRIAAEVADQISRFLGSKSKSRTKHVLLVGAGGPPRTGGLHRYGSEASSVEKIVGEVANGRRLLSDGVTLLGEVGHAVRNESAVSIGDFALRRTRLSLLTEDHGREDAVAIAETMQEELGWSDKQRDHELSVFQRELEAEGL